LLFFRGGVIKWKKSKVQSNKKDKLPFAVFVTPKTKNEEVSDYKQVFTDIISDRTKEKYRQKTRTKFRETIVK